MKKLASPIVKNSFLFLLLNLSLCYGGMPKQTLFDAKGNPTPYLLEILDTCSVAHKGTWRSITDETQKQWLIRSQERWEFTGKPDPHPKRTYFLFSRLHMLETVYPEEKEYDYGVILGATVDVVRNRVWFLKKLWDQGVRFRKLVVLTGDRPLAVQIENKAMLIEPSLSFYPFKKDWQFTGDIPKNETEMIRLVLDQLDLPKEWDSLEVVIVDTPKPPHARRPNTADTFDYWLKSAKLEPGKVLSVSSQPFIGRQDLIAKKYLLGKFYVETIGDGISYAEYVKNPQGLTVLLDELARWIYELSLN